MSAMLTPHAVTWRVATVAEYVGRERGQCHEPKADGNSWRTSDDHGDTAEQGNERKRADAGRRAGWSCALAAFSLHAQEQTDAEGDGETPPIGVLWHEGAEIHP